MSQTKQIREMRTSVQVQPERDRAGDTSMYSHMFLKDAVLRILPYRVPAPVVELRPEPGAATERLLVDGLYQQSGDLTRAVRGFFQDCARRVIADSFANYEFVQYFDVDTSSAVSFRLVPIETRLRRDGAEAFEQELPPNVEPERESRVVRMRSDAVIQVLPNEDHDLSKAYQALLSVGSTITPPFALDSLTGTGPYVPFDWDLFRNTKEHTVAEATREVGWNGRGLLASRLTEYYLLQRELNFARSVALLRESILTGLNGVLGRMGPNLLLHSHLVVNGVRSSSRYAELLELLRAGALSFKEITDELL